MPIQTKNRIPPDIMDQAHNANLVAYLQRNNYHIERDGSRKGYATYRMPGNGGLIVCEDGRWWHHSQGGKETGAYGRAVDFLMQYEGQTLYQAVETLTGYQVFPNQPQHRAPKPYTPLPKAEANKEPAVPFQLPERAPNDRRIFAYLCKTRGIAWQVLQPFVKEGRIYQEAKYGNVAFVGTDPEGIPRYCSLRGTTDTSTFKHDIPGSSKNHAFSVEGKTNTLRIYESPIEILSHMTLQFRQNKNAPIWDDHRLGLGCLGYESVFQYLDDNPNIKNAVIQVNNDKYGREHAEKLGKALQERGGLQVKVDLPPVKKHGDKDWNDLLRYEISQQQPGQNQSYQSSHHPRQFEAMER